MAIDSTLPTDPAGAQKALTGLAAKDQNETVCRYPLCEKPRKAAEKGGKPPAYCDNPGHTALKNFRARTYLQDMANGIPPVLIEPEQPVTAAQVQSQRDKTLVDVERLSRQMSLYMVMLRELVDPDITAAQIEAAKLRADAQIATAQEIAETERSLRLSAEHSRDTAQHDAQAAREGETLALATLHESEELTARQHEEYEQRLARQQREHEASLEAIRREAQQQMAVVKQQAQQDSALAQAAMVAAQEESRAANARAHDAETEARIAIAHADQRSAEARTALQREQDEVRRLRQLCDEQRSEAHARSEADHHEITQLRAALQEVNATARQHAEDDRMEIKQVREKLAAATKRADDLSLLIDTLRTQLLHMQITPGHELPHE